MYWTSGLDIAFGSRDVMRNERWHSMSYVWNSFLQRIQTINNKITNIFRDGKTDGLEFKGVVSYCSIQFLCSLPLCLFGRKTCMLEFLQKKEGHLIIFFISIPSTDLTLLKEKQRKNIMSQLRVYLLHLYWLCYVCCGRKGSDACTQSVLPGSVCGLVWQDSEVYLWLNVYLKLRYLLQTSILAKKCKRACRYAISLNH